MGRKRKDRLQRREVVSISLPRQLIQRLDESLGNRTRSRFIEGIIVSSLKNSQGSIQEFGLYRVWSCFECRTEWRTDRPKHRTIYCIKKSCRSDKIQMLYVEKGEEE